MFFFTPGKRIHTIRIQAPRRHCMRILKTIIQTVRAIFLTQTAIPFSETTFLNSGTLKHRHFMKLADTIF